MSNGDLKPRLLLQPGGRDSHGRQTLEGSISSQPLLGGVVRLFWEAGCSSTHLRSQHSGDRVMLEARLSHSKTLSFKRLF